jgi:transposase
MSHTASLPSIEVGVGIDTHRYFHQADFLYSDAQPAGAGLNFEESTEGYAQLRQALESIEARHSGVHFRVRLDAAGQYAANLECFLRNLPFRITFSVGEPARNKHYRQAIAPKRGKRDVTDSHACARFAVVERPSATPHDPEAFRLLREIAGRLESRVRQTTRAVNALHNVMSRVFPELATIVTDVSAQYVLELLAKYSTPEKIARAQPKSLRAIAYLTAEKADTIQAAAKRSVGSLRGEIAEQLVCSQVGQVRHAQQAEKEMEELLRKTYRALPKTPHVQVETITGIGELTAAVLVAKIVSIDRFETKGRLVCYFGAFPEANQSGRDKYGNPVAVGTMEMSRQGSDLVRRYLWMAAKSAARFNPAVRALYARLRARGKRGDVAFGHCMRKLLHLVFAVWKTDRPFDPNHYPWEKAAPGHKAQQETAGRKQDMPEKQAITAADSKIEAPASEVKQPNASNAAGNGRWVDFAWLRQQVTIEQVLQHVGCLEELSKSGSQRRGRCPMHAKPGERDRCFSVDVNKNVFQCFNPKCAIHGNVLDFWAAWRRLPLREAALDLAETFRLPTSPEQRRGTR